MTLKKLLLMVDWGDFSHRNLLRDTKQRCPVCHVLGGNNAHAVEIAKMAGIGEDDALALTRASDNRIGRLWRTSRRNVKVDRHARRLRRWMLARTIQRCRL